MQASTLIDFLLLLKAFEKHPKRVDIETLFLSINKVNAGYPNWHTDRHSLEFQTSPRRARLVEWALTENREQFLKYARYGYAVKFNALKTLVRGVKKSLGIRARRIGSQRTISRTRNCLFLYPELGIGGAERALLLLANALVKKGLSVDIYLIKERPKLNFAQFLDPAIRIIDFSEMRRTSYDTAINYAHWVTPEYMFSWCRSKRYVQYIHNDLRSLFGLYPRTRYEKWYKKIDAVICVSDGVRRSFMELFPFSSEKTVTINNVYDFSILEPYVHERKSRNPKNPKIRIVSVSRLVEAKGIRRCLQVARRLKDRKIDFVWEFIGQGVDEQSILSAYAELTLEKNVVFSGSLENPFGRIIETDIFVLASYYEGYGLSALEAKFLGIPVIVTDFCSAPEVINDGIDGLIVQNSIDGIESGLLRLIDDLGLRETISSNAEIARKAILDNNDESLAKALSMLSLAD